jgi:hypothetical protein
VPQALLSWREELPPAHVRWHARRETRTAPGGGAANLGEEQTGLTEEEALARALLRPQPVRDLRRIAKERKAQIEQAATLGNFALVAFDLGDLSSAKRALEQANQLMDGDLCCQHCGRDEKEQGSYAVCRQCFWVLEKAGREEDGEGKK